MATDPSSLTRMAGIMSGLDTEALVKAMSARTLNKIEKNKASSQKLKWQQETYQSVITKLQEFQDKYLGLTSTESVRLRGNLQKMSATSSNTALTATASSTALAGTYKISAATKAKAAKVSTQDSGGASGFSDGTVKLDFSKATNTTEGYSVDVTLDGNKKTISFMGGDEATARNNFNTALQDAFDDTYKTGQQFNLAADGTLTYDTSGAPDTVSHIFKVGYNDEAVGLKNDASNVVTPQSTIGEIEFNVALDESVDLYQINVNGKDLEFTKDSSITSIVSAINGAGAGVKAAYNTISGKFTIEASESGSGAEIELSQSSGNLLNSLFNIPVGSGAGSLAVTNSSVSDKVLEYKTFGKVTGEFKAGAVDDMKNGLAAGTNYNFKVEIDGNELDITLDSSKFAEGTSYTDEQIQNEIKSQIESGLGSYMSSTDAAALAAKTDVTLGTNSLTFTSADFEISITDAGDNLTKTGATGKNYTASRITGSMSPLPTGEPAQTTMTFTNGTDTKTITGKDGGNITLDDLTASGYFSLTADGHLVSKLNGYTAADAGAEALTSAYFGGSGTTLVSSSGSSAKIDSSFTGIYTKGSNASITVTDPSGAEATYENASDAFTVSGVTFNIEAMDEITAADAPVTVEVKKDTGAIKDMVVKFVDQYNTLVKEVTKIMSEKRPTSSGATFEPLTDEQRESYSEEEIKNWETQAKKGLLYNDQTLQNVLNDFSNAMITVSDGMTIFDMGITLSKDRSGGNIFEINEEELDKAINKYGDEIANFFTDAETGLATKLNKAVDGMIETSESTQGYLTQKAGIAGTRSATTNQIYMQIKEYDTLIASLQTRYESETARLWQKFTSLETALASLQDQTNALAQLGGTGA
ncbi:MAG: flagellar filament capping protein FliD [Ruminococcus sp.]|jgi:flagellar capping protein FliD|nr:flagellar filament capping protein FliD [Ruminococcus sp.]